ncbi:hypothetical protein XELAEV_18041155mg [Xenopus laevis]|uniref:Secreted protein n=1 Tax=Xenopus laevis TaxID=8355 RepID=A0A974C1X3_XENLA|nr:hypothetical protein XELAEV_18041155mg [Xenopus laevis]
MYDTTGILLLSIFLVLLLAVSVNNVDNIGTSAIITESLPSDRILVVFILECSTFSDLKDFLCSFGSLGIFIIGICSFHPDKTCCLPGSPLSEVGSVPLRLDSTFSATFLCCNSANSHVLFILADA